MKSSSGAGNQSTVDRLVMGCASLGLPYGLPVNGRAPVLMAGDTASSLVHGAIAAGITTFDTAPAYGCSEERLGEALAAVDGPLIPIVWTKCAADGDYRAEAIRSSIARSCVLLRRSRLDLVQIHNWSPAAEDAGLARSRKELAKDDRIGAWGCSTYGIDNALAAVRSGWFSHVQVEWNLLNQAVVEAIAVEARQRCVRIAVRSVLLQGVLSATPLPAHLAGLAAARDRVERLAAEVGLEVASLAIGAACQHPAIALVLVGLDHPAQLRQAVAGAVANLPLPVRERLPTLHCGGPLTDPRTWKAS